MAPRAALGAGAVRTAGASSSSGEAAVYRSRTGGEFTSVRTLPEPVAKAFDQRFNPVHTLDMDDSSVLYRITEKKYLDKKGRIGGNPESCARILNHEAIAPSPLASQPAYCFNMTEAERAELLQDPVKHHMPVNMPATELPDWSLNVMFGPSAEAGAKHYGADDGCAVVKMKLGDFKKAGGGLVYTDISAARSTPESQALIVTLPAGKRIPTQIV